MHTNIDFENAIKGKTPGDFIDFEIYNNETGTRNVTVVLGAVGKTSEDVARIRQGLQLSQVLVVDRSMLSKNQPSPSAQRKLHLESLAAPRRGPKAPTTLKPLSDRAASSRSADSIGFKRSSGAQSASLKLSAPPQPKQPSGSAARHGSAERGIDFVEPSWEHTDGEC